MTKTKRQIESDLRQSQAAAAALPELKREAAKVEKHKAALEQWENEGGWGQREVAARTQAEAIARTIHDKQSELLPLLKQLEGETLFRVIGTFYQVAELRSQLIATCRDGNYAAIQRAMAEARENAETDKLSYKDVQTIGASFGEGRVQNMVEEVDAGFWQLRGVPDGSKSQAIGNLCLIFAYPPKRQPQPLDANLGIPSRVPPPIVGVATLQGSVSQQLASDAMGKPPGKSKTTEGLFKSVSKGKTLLGFK